MVGLGDDHSDLDIGLPEGTDDRAYGRVLEEVCCQPKVNI